MPHLASLTTNLPNGVTNVDSNSAMGTLTQLDPTKLHTYLNDFNLYNASDWVVTTIEAGAGSATQAIVDETGGVLELTNDDANGDSIFLQSVNETFQFVAGKQLHFKARFKVSGGSSASLTGQYLMGLQIKDTTPSDASDGVYFLNSTSDLDLEVHVKKDNVDSSQTLSFANVLFFNEYIKVAFVYDGKSEVQFWVDDVKLATLDVTNLPTTELTVSFGVQNGNTLQRVMSIDYIYVANER